jgi:hypothetical protein
METTTQEIPDRVDGRQLPGFYVDSLTPLVHRRAAEAAVLRDRRLELEIAADGGVRARMVDGQSARLPVLRFTVGSGPFGQSWWVPGPNGLQEFRRRDDHLGMTERPSTLIASRATPSRPSDRLPALHRKAAEAAILRDGRLEIAIDDAGAVSARVVSSR